MPQVPRPPIQVRHIAKTPGVGIDAGRERRVPVGSCLHSMVGTLGGTDYWFRRLDVAALTDYGIGRADAGGGFAAIYEWNDPLGEIVPWANGGERGLEGDGPAFIAAYGWDAVNRDLVSIERDDGGVAGTLATAPQWSSICWLLAYVHGVLCRQTADQFRWQMQHREFAAKDCPHPSIYNHTAEYQRAVLAIMRRHQEGVPYPAGGLTVAGVRLTLPRRAGAFPMDERQQLLAFGETISYAHRGEPVREGVIDLREFGGAEHERYVQYERMVIHRLRGGNAILLLDLWDRLRRENKVNAF